MRRNGFVEGKAWTQNPDRKQMPGRPQVKHGLRQDHHGSVAQERKLIFPDLGSAGI